MSTMQATYYANYEDYNGYDEVACLVDTDKMEVVEFGAVDSSRWNENVMCVGETIVLADGREFDAIKTDEYEDAVQGGYADDYNRANIILFDADALTQAMGY